VIDRSTSRRLGALALYRNDGSFATVAARPPSQDRPWARAAPGAAPAATTAPAGSPPAARDATPRQDDLAPDD
jgi:hypothetical protein